MNDLDILPILAIVSAVFGMKVLDEDNSSDIIAAGFMVYSVLLFTIAGII